MNLVKNVKMYILLFSFSLLSIIILVGWYYERNSCMGIPLISTSKLDSYTEDLDVNIMDITFNGQMVVADLIRDTVYISQPVDLINHSTELQGKLDINNHKQKLYFLNNIQLQELKQTVNSGDYLTLIVVEDKSFSSIRVAISTLPVLSLNGQTSDEMTENGFPVYKGNLTMFAGWDPGKGKMTVADYSAEWHVRGGKSAKLSKKPQKLTLKKDNGDNLNADLLGMGSDDDWILNSMNLDDTKLREKSALDVWNNYIRDSLNDYPMSVAQYVEVVVNGEYQGLYLLQRRIDAKYLQLDKKHDIIFKGRQVWVANNLSEGYEIVYSPYDDVQTYNIFQEYLHAINESNYVNVNIFMQFLSAIDNEGYKNMFYVLKQEESGAYKLYLVPWDTDVSMGGIPSAGFINFYDYDVSMAQNSRRMDYYNMLLEYPDLDEKMAARWHELSGTVFGVGSIFEEILDSNKQLIMDSGAFTRDNQHWGYIYGGRDAIDNLFKWNKEKTEQLDEYWK